MELYEVMRTARTIRRFRDTPVPDDVLRRCLEAATWAPSGGNLQPCNTADAELRAVIGVPDEWKIATIVAVGYPKGNHGPVKRKPVEKVAFADRWDVAFR